MTGKTTDRAEKPKPHTVNVEAGVYAPEGVSVKFEDVPQDAAPQDAAQGVEESK
jgi:hypothetical protein